MELNRRSFNEGQCAVLREYDEMALGEDQAAFGDVSGVPFLGRRAQVHALELAAELVKPVDMPVVEYTCHMVVAHQLSRADPDRLCLDARARRLKGHQGAAGVVTRGEKDQVGGDDGCGDVGVELR
jgi:hypothetical protein